MAFGQRIRQVDVVASNAGHLLEEAVFGFIAHAPEWHKWPKSVTILIMVIYSYSHTHFNIRTYVVLYYIYVYKLSPCHPCRNMHQIVHLWGECTFRVQLRPCMEVAVDGNLQVLCNI